MARRLLTTLDQCVHYEADMYFEEDDGSYVFDASLLNQAHAWCQANVKDAMGVGIENIVVSNTFTQNWQVEPYLKLAETFGYTVISFVMEKLHDGVNSHGVPDEKLQAQAKQLQESIKLL